jgi:hypothetical protein
VLRGFFHAVDARVHFAQTECPKLAVKIPVAIDELYHVVVGSYPWILNPIFDAVEIINDRSVWYASVLATFQLFF